MLLKVANRKLTAQTVTEGPRDTRFGRLDCLQLLFEKAPSPSEIEALTQHVIETDDGRVFTGYAAVDSVSVLLFRPTDEAERRRELDKKEQALREMAALLPDKAAVLHAELFPGMRFDGQELKVGERFNWNGVLHKLMFPAIDNLEHTPAARPDLWKKLPGQG